MPLSHRKRFVREPARAARIIALLATSVFLAAMPVRAAEVTALRVKFADAVAPAPDAADAAAALVAGASRLAVGSATALADGSFEIRLAVPVPFEAARDALNRLRMEPALLYASIASTEAPAGAPAPTRVDTDAGALLSRIIVKYRDRGSARDAGRGQPLSQATLDVLAQRAGRVLAWERSIDWAAADLLSLLVRSPRSEVEAIARAIASHPDVEWAQPDYLREPLLVPNDPLYPNQWHYQPATNEVASSNLPAAWDRTRGWSGVRVAVLDTGALLAHPDLASRYLGGYDFVSDYIVANDGDPPQPPGCANRPDLAPCISSRDAVAADPGDWVTNADAAGSTFGGWLAGCQVRNSSWHGSHVAGTVGAATGNSAGVAGVNWVSRIVPVRVLGKCGGYDSDISDGIIWASGGSVGGVPANPHPARVLNLSLGGAGACGALRQAAIDGALARGSVVVVAAGNAATETSQYTPANCNGVITVAALARDGQRAGYSNFDDNDGSGITVEIAAPGGTNAGGGVLSTLNSGLDVPLAGGHTYGSMNGTSMAAPHVAGVVSLMLSLKPSLTPAQVSALLQSTARPFVAFPVGPPACTSNLASVTSTIKYCGAGMLDAAAVLNQIMATGGPGGTPLAAATASLATSANPAVGGTNITLTATVTGVAPGGSVAFLENDAALPGCATVPLAGAGNTRTAQCVLVAPPSGNRFIVARYAGDASNTPADSAVLTQAVQPGGAVATTTVVSTAPQPSAQGAAVAITASVTGYEPTGNVAFLANGGSIAGCAAVALTGSGSTRSASCNTAALPAGAVTIAANYAGNANNQPSGGTTMHHVYGAGACGVFNDMAQADPFCRNVQWMFNRGVTLGCMPIGYCPVDSVSRLAMAAFMNRLAVNPLTPFDWQYADELTISLATPQIACATGPFSVAGAPARASLRVMMNVYGPGASMAIAGEPVWSADGGLTWNVMPGGTGLVTIYSGRFPTDDQSITFGGAVDLSANAGGLHFGLRVTRTAGSSGSAGLYCSTWLQISGRNADTPPY